MIGKRIFSERREIEPLRPLSKGRDLVVKGLMFNQDSALRLKPKHIVVVGVLPLHLFYVVQAHMVDLECGNMVVASQAGQVELRSGGSAKAVAAGTSESAGTPQPGTRCTRLTKPDSFGHLSGGALAALLLAAGGAVAAAIFASNHDDTLNFGGSVTVVSPTR